MSPTQRYPILSTLLAPFPKRHRTTLAWVIAALTVTAQARSMAVATTLTSWLRIHFGSALNRLYRLLRNPRLDDLLMLTQLARTLGSPAHPLLLAVDWTEWHHDLRMLVCAFVTGRRALPIWTQAVNKRLTRRSQNAQENTFLRLLAHGLKQAGRTAIILCDRGFRRASWLKLLQDQQMGFVVRLMDDVHVEVASGMQMALADLLLTPGRLLDLGPVWIRSDRAVLVRVVGYWAQGAKQPWWLATSETGPARRVLALYDRRMTIEEQFRDTKGCRFGVKLFWTHFTNPVALAHLMMLLGVALMLWLVVGQMAARRTPSLRLPCPKKGPRQSYVTIGLRAIGAGWHGRLTESLIRRTLEPPAFRHLGAHALGGK